MLLIRMNYLAYFDGEERKDKIEALLKVEDV